jgi:hypothetical protein
MAWHCLIALCRKLPIDSSVFDIRDFPVSHSLLSFNYDIDIRQCYMDSEHTLSLQRKVWIFPNKLYLTNNTNCECPYYVHSFLQLSVTSCLLGSNNFSQHTVLKHPQSTSHPYRGVSKSKAVPPPSGRANGERRYSSHSFLISAIDGLSCQRHAPANLCPGKGPRFLLDRRLGGPQSWSGYRR